MNYLIVGASSGLGRELCYTFAKNNNNLIICSRDLRDLTAIKSDIEKKFKVKVESIEIDLTSKENIKKILANKKLFKKTDGILFPVGLMFEKDKINLEVEKINKLIQANFSSIACIISTFLSYKNKGLIVGFGSVSGYLGRELNTYYAASKRALESYFESIGFENKKNNMKIQFYTLGYLETNLSFGKKLILPKGSPQILSEIVYKNRNQKLKKYFFPKWWSLIVFLLKILPYSLLVNFSILKK